MGMLKAVIKYIDLPYLRRRMAILGKKMRYSLEIVGELQELVVGLLLRVLDKIVMKGDMEPSTIPNSFGGKTVGAASFFFDIP